MATIAFPQRYLRMNIPTNRRNQMTYFLVILVLMDVVTLALAFAIAHWIRFEVNLPLFQDIDASRSVHRVMIFALIPLWMAVFAYSHLYDPHYLLGSTQEYKKAFNACSVAFTLVVVGTFLFPIVRVSRGWLVLAWAMSIGFVLVERFMLRHVAYRLRARGVLRARTLIVGIDEEARAIARQIVSMDTSGAQILGFVDGDRTPGTKVEGDLPVIGSIDALPELVASLGVEELIISASALPRERVLQVFEAFGHSDDVELRFSPGLFEIYTSGVRVKEIGNVPLLSMRKVRLDGIESTVKALNDYLVAILTLLVASPLLLLVAVLIKLDSPGPVFYRRRVVGTGGREFDAFKFRTMRVDGAEILAQNRELQARLQNDYKLKQDPRVTRIGTFLRRYSLDEIPQLLNVLWGQMSVVGPRMISPSEAEKYGKWRLNLQTVKPGLTGLWQINGRSDLSYEERVRLDMYYIRNYTVWFDLQILLRTLPVVLQGKGAY